jgi:hypothetical protein
MGNNVTLIIEYHQHLIQDTEEKRQATIEDCKEATEKLKYCGLRFVQVLDSW